MKSKLVLLVISVLVLGFGLIRFNALWTLQPFITSESYVAISQIAAEESGSVYSIADSKKTIHKVDASGKLVYSFSSAETGSGDAVRLFDSIVADDSGRAYALVTILDANGLKVTGEQIIEISPNGSQHRVLYEETYDPSENLFRVGKIQSLSVRDGEIRFFRNEESAAVYLSLPVTARAGQAPEVLRQLEMPNDRYLKEIISDDADNIFFTTKRGALFRVQGLNAVPLNANAGGAGADLTFPIAIDVSGSGKLYYINHFDESVYAIDLNAPDQAPRKVLSLSMLQQQYPDAEWSELTDVFVNDSGIAISTAERIVRLDNAWNITEVQDGYRFPFFVMVLKIAYWVALAVFAALAVLAIRAFYIEVMKRKLSLLLKQLLAIFPIVLASMILLSLFVYNAFAAEMKTAINNQLKLLAANGKYLVQGDHLERLNSPRDYMSEDYVAIKTRLGEVFSQSGEDRDGLYNTIYRYKDGVLYVIMDDDDSVEMFRPFQVSEENLPVLERGEIVTGEWTDAKGEWMYALGPIYNSRGEVVGIYETGKDLTGIHRSNKEIRYEVMWYFGVSGLFLLLAIAVMTFFLLRSIGKLRRNVNLFASGEWDAHVNLRTRDEVEELGERFNMMARSIKQYILEVTKLSNSYFRFVPQQFLKVLGKTNVTQIRLGEQQKKRMTILVCNMRNFTDFSAKLSTEENFRFINSFLKRFGPVIREYGGFTSRYLGPGMLALFPNDASSALKAALKLRAVLKEYNEYRAQKNYEPVDIGIAIHTGDVMLGIIGEEQRMEGSVVSHHVQIALDLERLSAKLGVSVLLTGDTMQAVKTVEGQYRKLGEFQIDEDHPPIELYDLFEGDSELIRRLKKETKAQFEAAVEAFRQGRFYDARERFVQVMKKNRYDLTAKLYFFECDKYFQQGVSADWNHALRIS